MRGNSPQSADTSQSGIQPFDMGISKKKRKKQKQMGNSGYKRALIDPRPLHIPDGLLTSTLKELVGQIHGDFGRASVATGNVVCSK